VPADDAAMVKAELETRRRMRMRTGLRARNVVHLA
jgi:hypothetical protein